MPTQINKELYGTTVDGQQVDRYTMTNSNDVRVDVISFGGIITSILMPDKDGKFDDITTGFDTLAEYERNTKVYFGAICGRVVNRIHNGKFTLDDVNYQLVINNRMNHIHGGITGFDKKVWSCRVEGEGLKMSYTSVDGEEGYPGTLIVEVVYKLNDDNELAISYIAKTDKPTIINLTNHAYFNLAGHKAVDINDHVVVINADYYLKKTEDDVPSGEVADVGGTLFDLRQPVQLGDRLLKIPGPPNGYDHNFCLTGGEKFFAASVDHPASGRRLEVHTNQPAVQFYTSNFLDGLPGKDGAIYQQRSSLTLETQNYPDAINHANFPTSILRPGEIYDHKCWYKFSTKA